MGLVDTLVALQQSTGWNDTEFARELGIHQSSWWLIRNGRRQPGVQFLRRVVARFPTFQVDCLRYLGPEGEG